MTSPRLPSPELRPLPSAPAESTGKFADVVSRVRAGEEGGMNDLYECLLQGLRPYLTRQLQPQDLFDKVHNIFLDVVLAIQRGQLRNPERLMGFARTIARRKVFLYIGNAASDRRNHVEIGSIFGLASPCASPEQESVSREQREVVQRIMVLLSEREREILSRFYFQEQGQAQICREMRLSHTQYRLLKWRSKARFERLSKDDLAVPHRLHDVRRPEAAFITASKDTAATRTKREAVPSPRQATAVSGLRPVPGRRSRQL